MPNPYLPLNEYIPDGEPRVFGNRVYVYGSHDSACSDKFCDYKLKVWSAPVDNLNSWVCHGDAFHTRADCDHTSDVDWTDNELYAPDVIEKNGKYYLYAYIFDAHGCVAVSDKPEGPFQLLSKYKYSIPEEGWFIDPGVLVDDDGRVYIYWGFERSFAAEVNPDNMYELIDGTYVEDIIPKDAPFDYFEACSPRKIGDTYYLIYSPTKGSRLVYATSKAPLGPFEYQGVIVDNSQDYPGGNNHGSLCNINNQWYIFYHRMTNGTIMSRRACVEKVNILPNGKIEQAEMTSLGFEEALNPFYAVKAEIACVLNGGCFITERNAFERPVVNITDGCIIGYKYFDFGEDYSSMTMQFCVKVRGTGCKSKITLMLDSFENGDIIGECEIGSDDGVYAANVKSVVGRHAVFLIVKSEFAGWFKDMFNGRQLFELEEFLFIK